MIKIISIAALLTLSGCGQDTNSKPIYGETGLPKNCRAYVQTVIDGYKNKSYTAEQSMAGLERNCGLYGSSWGEK